MSGPSVVVLAGFAPGLLGFRSALLQAMVERGCRVTACAPEAEPWIGEAMGRLGVAYRPVPFGRTAIRPDRDLALLHRLYRLFRELRPDVTLTNMIKPVIYGSLAARAAGVPRVYSLISGLGFAFADGGGLRQRLVTGVASTLYRAALAGNQRVMFQNPDDRALFLERHIVADPARTEVVNGSGVDLAHYALAPPAGPPPFLMIARLIGAKGVRDYAAAARQVRRHCPAARFRLVGWLDGSPDAIAPAELEAWVAAGDIEFLGKLNDIRPAMADAAVYVLPSFYREGTPRSVLEALAMGRPVVTTDMPGCRETVADGVNGFVVPPRDPAALTAAMLRFVEEPGLAASMGAASRRLAESRYDVHSVNRCMLEAMGL